MDTPREPKTAAFKFYLFFTIWDMFHDLSNLNPWNTFPNERSKIRIDVMLSPVWPSCLRGEKKVMTTKGDKREAKDTIGTFKLITSN